MDRRDTLCASVRRGFEGFALPPRGSFTRRLEAAFEAMAEAKAVAQPEG